MDIFGASAGPLATRWKNSNGWLQALYVQSGWANYNKDEMFATDLGFSSNVVYRLVWGYTIVSTDSKIIVGLLSCKNER